MLQILASGLGSALLVRSACTLLRQLANSDAIKAEIVENKGLDLFCRAVDAHISNGGKPTECLCHLYRMLLQQEL